jgi:hypothetical protein
MSPYRFALERDDFSDLASGKVFHSLPGHPAFPVRLASEIFQRCLAARQGLCGAGGCVLYDPCCGAGYHLSVLAVLHGEDIDEVIGSDIDERAVRMANLNLGMLTLEGLERRMAEIRGMLESYGKESHREALASARALRARVAELTDRHPIRARTFCTSALNAGALRQNLAGRQVDIVFTDIPYGEHSHWLDPDTGQEPERPIESMLTALTAVLAPGGVVAVACDKRQRAAHPAYERIEHFQVGKRRISLFNLAS